MGSTARARGVFFGLALRHERPHLIRAVMEGAAAPVVNLAVPLVADAGVGDNWDEAH